MKRKFEIATALLAILLISAPASGTPGAPNGWTITGSKPQDYTFGTEHIDGSEGKQSAYIKARPNASPDGFGTLMQFIKADNYIGQRLRLSARLKSVTTGRLQLWMRIDGVDKMLAFYNMDDHPITGTTDWKRYEIVLDVPVGSTYINYGFLLSGGKGSGWADAFSLEAVDKNIPVSLMPPASISTKPVNMNFDQ